MSLNAVGTPHGDVLSALWIFQKRAFVWSIDRTASVSVSSTVGTAFQALPVGLYGPDRLGDRVDLDDRVQRAVDRHVHPHAEEVLMVRRVQAGR